MRSKFEVKGNSQNFQTANINKIVIMMLKKQLNVPS